MQDNDVLCLTVRIDASGAHNLGNFFRLVLFTQSQTLHAKVFRVWVFYVGPRTLAKIRDFTLYFATNLKPV